MPLVSELGGVQRVDQLAGDGSTRSYYRVLSEGKSFVLQTNGSDEISYRRFLEAQKFYLQAGIPVPKLLAHHDETRWILLEDLGAEDLQSVVSPDYLESAVKLLALLAPAKLEKEFSQCWLAERTLDEARFVFEMNYFVEHFVEKLLGEKASPQLVRELHDLAAKAAQGPRVFCHRDYQSRNLMKSPQGDLVMIDFQDSQWGPALYDAVSICWDPYFVMSFADRDALFATYLAALDPAKLNADFRALVQNADALEQHKHLLIAERFIKAVGSFASFKTIRGKDTHLVYVMDSFKMVAPSLAALGLSYPVLNAAVARWQQLAERKGWRRSA